MGRHRTTKRKGSNSPDRYTFKESFKKRSETVKRKKEELMDQISLHNAVVLDVSMNEIEGTKRKSNKTIADKR